MKRTTNQLDSVNKENLEAKIMLASNVSDLNQLSFQRFSADTTADSRPNSQGAVFARQAPDGVGNVNALKQNITAAGLPNSVKDSALANGPFAANIAEQNTVKTVVNKLKNRPNEFTGPGKYISTTARLNELKAEIGQNKSQKTTYVLQGNLNVNQQLKLGSNTDIVVDGAVKYTGPRVETVVADPKFSPLGVRAGGLFNIQGVSNVSITGTKRSAVNLNGNAAGVYAKDTNQLSVEGVNFNKGQDTIFLDGNNKGATVKENYVENSSFRAIWLKFSRNSNVANNLLFNNDLDGVDVDAFSKNNNIEGNVSVGVNKRLHFWNEIGSTDNKFRDNIAIHNVTGKPSGGIQENGSEVGQANTARNLYARNHVFNARAGGGQWQGLSINENRGTDVSSHKFQNNFVWSTGGGFTNNQDILPAANDVRYLTRFAPKPV